MSNYTIEETHSGSWVIVENGKAIEWDRVESLLNAGRRAEQWRAMDNSEMRLHAGEMTASECRTTRAVINNIAPDSQ